MSGVQKSEENDTPTDVRQPIPKRKRQTPAQLAARVARACDRCRGRKYKCDGGHPCSSCLVNGQSCTYDPVLRRRGLPEGYVRGLERLLGLAISRDKSFETLVLSIASHDHQGEVFSMGSPIQEWNVEKLDEKLHESWKQSAISGQMEAMIPALEYLEAHGVKRRRHEPVNSPRTAPSCSTEQPQADGCQQDTLPQTCFTPVVAEALPQRLCHTHLQPSSSSVEHMDLVSLQMLTFRAAVPRTLPSRTGRLLDCYFTFTHCWLPFIERHDLLRLSYRYPEISGDLSPGGSGTGEVAALWALLAYTDHATIDSSSLDSNELTTEQLYSAAKALLPPERSTYELGHVQALIIMVLYNMRYSALNTAWILIGQAVRVAISLGLDKPALPLEFSDQPRKVEGRDSHVFLACFALDTLLAGRLNRLPHLRRESLLHLGPLFEDGPEEWEPWIDSQAQVHAFSHFRNPSFTASTFNRLVEVMVVLNESICNTNIGLEWEKQHSLLRARLADTAAKFKNRAQRQTQKVLPHHAVLHLLHCSTLVFMRLHTLSHSQNRRTSHGIAPMSAQLTSQLQQCLDVFGSVQYPPLLGFSALLALKEDEAFSFGPSVASDVAWKEQLLNIALKLEVRNNGFREIQNAIALSKFSSLNSFDPLIAQPVIPKPPFVERRPGHFWSTPAPETPLFDYKPLQNARRASSQVEAVRLDSTTNLSTVPSPTSKLLTGGEFGDIGPFETATAILVETPPATNIVLEPVRSEATAETEADDGDTAFLSLAHLDTTQWSSNWEDGLAELGFASDSMFREFCNDPDRLFSEENAGKSE